LDEMRFEKEKFLIKLNIKGSSFKINLISEFYGTYYRILGFLFFLAVLGLNLGPHTC
jgi:hypothetical protein